MSARSDLWFRDWGGRYIEKKKKRWEEEIGTGVRATSARRKSEGGGEVYRTQTDLQPSSG